MLTIFDSHWLPYRNAEVRAFALDDKTIPLNFYNITDAEADGDNIGQVVNTDERGFLHYGGGAGLQNVECLAVKESAIIQVARPTGEILSQWVLKVGQKPLTATDLGTLTYADGTLAFNPAVPREWKLRDFALASDVRKGIWQEAQTSVLDADAASTKLSKWQSVIYIPAAFTGGTLDLDVSPLLADNEPRFGLKFLVVNGSSHDVEVRQAGITSGSSATIPAGHQVCACAVFYLNVTWLCALAFDDTPAELKQLRENVGNYIHPIVADGSASYGYDAGSRTTTVRLDRTTGDDIVIAIDFAAIAAETGHNVGTESTDETLRFEIPAAELKRRWTVVATPDPAVQAWGHVFIELAIAGGPTVFRAGTVSGSDGWERPKSQKVMLVAETQRHLYFSPIAVGIFELHSVFLHAKMSNSNFGCTGIEYSI